MNDVEFAPYGVRLWWIIGEDIQLKLCRRMCTSSDCCTGITEWWLDGHDVTVQVFYSSSCTEIVINDS